MPSLSTTALRLAIVEALAPIALVLAEATTGWPTLLGPRVLDSGSVPLDRLAATPEADQPFGSVFVDEVRGTPRGDAYGYDPQDLTAEVVIDLEIPIAAEGGGFVAAETDADAAAKLECIAAQVRHTLATSPLIVPRLVTAFGPMTARWSRDPDMAVRLARLTLRLTCDIDDDDWSRIDGGLPWPASMVRAALPAASYGAAVLDQLAGIFATGDLDRLETIRFGFGPDRPDDLASAPIAGAVDLTED